MDAQLKPKPHFFLGGLAMCPGGCSRNLLFQFYLEPADVERIAVVGGRGSLEGFVHEVDCFVQKFCGVGEAGLNLLEAIAALDTISCFSKAMPRLAQVKGCACDVIALGEEGFAAFGSGGDPVFFSLWFVEMDSSVGRGDVCLLPGSQVFELAELFCDVVEFISDAKGDKRLMASVNSKERLGVSGFFLFGERRGIGVAIDVEKLIATVSVLGAACGVLYFVKGTRYRAHLAREGHRAFGEGVFVI